MYCPNCDHELLGEEAYCTNCGIKLPQYNSGFCLSCNAVIPRDAFYCNRCGAKTVTEAEEANMGGVPTGLVSVRSEATSAQTQQINTANLVGFSKLYQHPEILKAVKESRRTNLVFLAVLVTVPLVGFPLAGLFLEEYPLNEGIILGVVLAIVIVTLDLFVIWGARRPIWEGEVIKQSQRDRRKRRSRHDPTYIDWTEYTTVIKTDNGKKKRIIEKNADRHMYDYLSVGDRVRYYPALGTYEKHDKSLDRIIYCNVCSMMNPIKNDRCQRCKNLLFK